MYFQCINGAKPMTGPSQINGLAAAPPGEGAQPRRSERISAPPTG